LDEAEVKTVTENHHESSTEIHQDSVDGITFATDAIETETMKIQVPARLDSGVDNLENESDTNIRDRTSSPDSGRVKMIVEAIENSQDKPLPERPPISTKRGALNIKDRLQELRLSEETAIQERLKF
jgi:hypothetical protein